MALRILIAEDDKLQGAATQTILEPPHDAAAPGGVPFLVTVAVLAAVFAWTSAPLPRMESLAVSVQPAHNAEIALIVFAVAALYGLMHAVGAVRRRWSGDAWTGYAQSTRNWYETVVPSKGPWSVSGLLRQKS